MSVFVIPSICECGVGCVFVALCVCGRSTDPQCGNDVCSGVKTLRARLLSGVFGGSFSLCVFGLGLWFFLQLSVHSGT